MLKLIFVFLCTLTVAYPAPFDISSLLGSKCQETTEKLKISQCIPLYTEFAQKSAAVSDQDLKINDPKIVASITLCKKLMICLEPTCVSDTIKDTIYLTCTGIELSNTEFMKCVHKIQKETPDLSKYDCLEESDYINGTLAEDMGTTEKKDCLKTVLSGYCGDKALDNFDENLAKLNRTLEVSKSVVLGMFAGLENFGKQE